MNEKQDRIRKRAYALWQSDGMPDGEHERHWRAAELEINGKYDDHADEDLPTEGATHATQPPATPPYMEPAPSVAEAAPTTRSRTRKPWLGRARPRKRM